MSVKTKQKLTLLLLVLLVFTLAFIWGNSLQDSEESADISNGVLDMLAPMLEVVGLGADDDRWLRKLAHFAEFGLLGMELSFLAILRNCINIKGFSFAALFCLFVAVVDELIQLFVGRSSQVSDVMLDFFGSICAILVVYMLYCANKKCS